MFEEIGEFDRPGGDGGNCPRGGKAKVKLLDEGCDGGTMMFEPSFVKGRPGEA
jgi:hypothetical protein